MNRIIIGAALALLPLIMLLPNAHAEQKPTLVTNGFAFRHPDAKGAARSPDWEMTAGSLFALPNGAFWTGVPDGMGDDLRSAKATNSAVFRMASTRRDYGDTKVSITFDLAKFSRTPRTPEEAWDGVHLMLRYQSQYELYYVSIARRDGSMVIKKKCPGGPSNGGTYYELSPVIHHPVPLGTDVSFAATVANTAHGTVRLALSDAQGNELLSAEDAGLGCAPMTQAGGIGVRGDNAEFTFALRATPLP